MVTVSWSLQRARHGEQPLWLGVVLAAMLGQIGLPGGGFGHGYGSTALVGEPAPQVGVPRLRQGPNAVSTFIPVARIADMLLNPGAGYDYNGQRLTYPDIRLVYWCGGNPFHHHQDLARLRTAFARPETVVVHDPFWTATARHADIVLPATMSIERDDFGSGQNDRMFFPMRALTRPHGQARDDYAIFADLADRLGAGKDFTEGRTAMEWLRHLYGEWRDSLGQRDVLAPRGRAPVPGFDEFWAGDGIELPVASEPQVALAEFRLDPTSIRSPRRPGRSRSSPRPSTDTGTRTARATRSGWSRTSGSARWPRSASACNWSPTSRGRDCTASSTSARTASR
jgi:biotin/methionine sulfoxide reductase